MSDGVTGNTSDFGSEESRFETWSDNKKTWCGSRTRFFFALPAPPAFTEHLVLVLSLAIEEELGKVAASASPPHLAC